MKAQFINENKGGIPWSGKDPTKAPIIGKLLTRRTPIGDGETMKPEILQVVEVHEPYYIINKWYKSGVPQVIHDDMVSYFIPINQYKDTDLEHKFNEAVKRSEDEWANDQLNKRLGYYICPVCNGTGTQTISVDNTYNDDEDYEYVADCIGCGGSGKVDKKIYDELKNLQSVNFNETVKRSEDEWANDQLSKYEQGKRDDKIVPEISWPEAPKGQKEVSMQVVKMAHAVSSLEDYLWDNGSDADRDKWREYMQRFEGKYNEWTQLPIEDLELAYYEIKVVVNNINRRN